jgi:hypothetical protein
MAEPFSGTDGVSPNERRAHTALPQTARRASGPPVVTEFLPTNGLDCLAGPWGKFRPSPKRGQKDRERAGDESVTKLAVRQPVPLIASVKTTISVLIGSSMIPVANKEQSAYRELKTVIDPGSDNSLVFSHVSSETL